MIDETLLHKINLLVVDAGHKLVKKKEDEALKLKTDSYAVETNVHFPTDLNLLWDSLRKCLDMVEDLVEITDVKGWRKIKNLRKIIKSLFRSTSQHLFKGKNEQRKKQYVKQYLLQARMLTERIEELIKKPPLNPGNAKQVLSIIIFLEK